jgi:hypothetical protein
MDIFVPYLQTDLPLFHEKFSFAAAAARSGGLARRLLVWHPKRKYKHHYYGRLSPAEGSAGVPG